MATATFYTTSKRHNSTLIPTGGTDIAVNLKGGADLNAPLFVLSSATIPTYSMMKFEGKYYFINKIRNIRDQLYEIECSVDVLATYKANIQAMSPYVLYYTHNNGEITDARLSAKTSATFSTAEGNFDTLGATPATNSAIVVSITGEDSIGCYAMSQNDLRGLLSASVISTWGANIAYIEAAYPYEFEEDLVGVWHNIGQFFRRSWEYLKLIFSSATYKGTLMDSIKSAIQVPLSIADVGGYAQTIKLGSIDTGVVGLLVYDRIFSDGATVAIPWQANDWRRNNPYTEIYLYIPWVGVINISASDVMGANFLTVHASVDKFTGSAIFSVETDKNKCVYYGTSNIGSVYPVGSSNISPLAAASSIAGVAASALTGNATGFAVSTLGLANALKPNPTCIGSNSGAAGQGLNGNKIFCWTVFHDTTVAPNSVSAEVGTPYNGVLALNTVVGYVKTLNASVSGSMTDDERDEINNLMDGGVYIE